MAFTGADMEGKGWLEARMRDAGLEVSRDGAANISGVIHGKNRDAPRIMVGSHIDTVPCAGTLDGTLGVLTGLECLRQLVSEGWEPERTVELIAFSDEEGRFGGMLGSQAVAGLVNPKLLHDSTDLDGIKLTDAMAKHGLDPWEVLDARRAGKSIAAYLELHIEQGPVLDTSDEQVGLVEAITGLFKWSVTFSGEPNHAGTTPMEMRHDSFMGVADFTHEIPRILEENGSEQSRATVGKIDLHPGSANTVPGRATFSLDVRDTSEEILAELAPAFEKALRAIGRRRGLQSDFEIESEIAPVTCAPGLVDLLEDNAARLGLRHRRMPSGAAHDAQIIAGVAPVAMVFVPSRGGRSHSPAEWTAWNHIEAGANLMLGAVRALGEAANDSPLVNSLRG